ncbi:MAG: DUF1294 domain-containing protein [Patescibacteria group bacterium]
MLMNNYFFSILIIFGLINLLAFLIMAADKIKSSRPDAPRISEGKLFFMATAFGALGVYLGMFTFRHKTRKWYFLAGIPLLIVQNAATAYLVYLLIISS